MSSLTIILNPALLPKPIPDIKDIAVADRGLISKYITLSEEIAYPEPHTTYRERTENGLINAFLLAYNNHLPLRLKPDDIHLALQMVCSTALNNRGGQGPKIALQAKMVHFDFHEFTNQMHRNIRECMEAADSRSGTMLDALQCQYSTTTKLITAVSMAITMNTFQCYFSYSIMLGCGIPSIIMEGTREDWELLHQRYQILKIVFMDDLKSWFAKADPIFDMFRDLRNLQDDGQVTAPDRYVDMWARAVTIMRYGSGKQTKLAGWINILSPYGSDNRLRPDNTTGRIWRDMQSSMFRTPVEDVIKEKVGGEDYILVSGFSPKNHINERGEVCLNYHIQLLVTNPEYTMKMEDIKKRGIFFRHSISQQSYILYVPRIIYDSKDPAVREQLEKDKNYFKYNCIQTYNGSRVPCAGASKKF